MKPKMFIVLSQYRFSCGAGMDFYRTQSALKGMPQIRHEKGKTSIFDAERFVRVLIDEKYDPIDFASIDAAMKQMQQDLIKKLEELS